MGMQMIQPALPKFQTCSSWRDMRGRDSEVLVWLVVGCGWLLRNLVTVTGWCLGLLLGLGAIWVVPGFWRFDYWICVTSEVEPGFSPVHGFGFSTGALPQQSPAITASGFTAWLQHKGAMTKIPRSITGKT